MIEDYLLNPTRSKSKDEATFFTTRGDSLFVVRTTAWMNPSSSTWQRLSDFFAYPRRNAFR